MVSFKALKYITCRGVDYAPNDVIPDAAEFPNLREMLEWRYIGYATKADIEKYQKDQIEAKKAAKEKAKADLKAEMAAEAAAAKEAEEKAAADKAGKDGTPTKG